MAFEASRRRYDSGRFVTPIARSVTTMKALIATRPARFDSIRSWSREITITLSHDSRAKLEAVTRARSPTPRSLLPATR